MKITHCLNPSNSTPREKGDTRLCFDNLGGRRAMGEKASHVVKTHLTM